MRCVDASKKIQTNTEKEKFIDGQSQTKSQTDGQTYGDESEMKRR